MTTFEILALNPATGRVSRLQVEEGTPRHLQLPAGLVRVARGATAWRPGGVEGAEFSQIDWQKGEKHRAEPAPPVIDGREEIPPRPPWRRIVRPRKVG